MVNVVFKEVLSIYVSIGKCVLRCIEEPQFVTFWTEHIHVFIYFTVLMVVNGIMLYFSWSRLQVSVIQRAYSSHIIFYVAFDEYRLVKATSLSWFNICGILKTSNKLNFNSLKKRVHWYLNWITNKCHFSFWNSKLTRREWCRGE